MQDQNINNVIKILKKELAVGEMPIVSHLAADQRDPFVILISTLLSLRTKDEVTAVATERLFHLASTPQEFLKLPLKKIEQAIFPVGFYHVKAKTVKHACEELIDRFNSKVPDNLDDLLSMKGVGRKTANLVIALAYGKDAICVDTHVHRISNRLGLVLTKTPKQTEIELKKILPQEYWVEWNRLLVMWGQNICVPISPFCSQCAIFKHCQRVGVTKSR
jgi:endonuclease III